MLMLLAAAPARSQESLRITPLTYNNHVVVSFELNDAYNEAVREAIASGLRTTFTYTISLRMNSALWLDPTVATAVVSSTDEFDNLTRRHKLTRAVDGRVVDALVTEDAAVARKWLTTLDRVPVCTTAKLDQNRDYYVRISAQARPRGGSLLGFTSAVTGQAKFTLIR